MIQSSSSAASASTAVSETSSTANASETSSSTIVASSAEASSASASETSADVSQATSAESSTTTSAPKSAASSSSSAAVSAVTSQTSSSQTSSVATSSVSSVASSESTGTSALGTKATKNSTVSSSAVSTRAAVANSSAASTSTVEKVTTLNSDALTNLQNELPTGSVVTTQADGTVVIALAVGADEKAVKALVANSDLNSAVVITAKDANVVVPNLNSTTSINKAGEVYTGSSSTVAGDFTAAGTATVPNSSGSSSLTTATNNQSGYLVLNNQLNFSSSFTMSGTVVLGNSSDGADGLTFVFSPSNPSQLTTSGTGGNLGLGGLPNSFGLAIDEYYNTAFGDFDNANALPWQIMKPAAGTISWRTTDSSGKLNTNTRVGDGGIFSNVGNVSAQDTTSQVVSINRGIMDGRAHAFTISYNAATSVLTITLPDNNSGSNQVYGRTGATSASTWTRTLTAAQKIGMSLSIAASTGDKVNAFGVTILNYSYTKATAPVTYQETDTSGKVITGTTSHTITANVGDVIQVFADQASANAAIAAGTASANLTMVAPSIPGYVLRNSVTTTVLVGSTSVNLVYNRQTAAITVHYQDYSGNTISKDAVLTGSYGDANVNGTTITNPAVPTIAGYTFSATDAKNVPATAINFTAVDANGNVYVTDASGKAITAITLYYKTNATVTLSGTETEGYTGNQQAPKAGNYKITLPTGVTYALKDSDIQLVSGGINAGTYAVKLSTTGINNITAAIGNNYAIDFGTATGSFIIKAADTTVTLSGSETEQYTGAQQAPKAGNYKITLPTGVTYVLKDSDIQLVSGGTNAGTYNVVLSTTGKTAVQAAITAATGTNYNAATFDSAAGTTFVITKAPLTATISSTTKVYDGATVTMPTVAYTVISGSMASPAISWTSSDFEYLASDGQTVVANPTNVGTYTVQFSAAGQAKLTAAQVAGGAAQNYTVTPANGTATITPATATANLTGSQTVPYNGATQSPNASHYNVLLSNGTTYTLKTGDVALVSGSDGKNVGTYTVQLTRTGLTNIAAALTTATDGNYTTVTLGKTSGTFIITPVSATVTLSGTETKTYTGQQLSPSAGNYQVTLPTGVTYTLKDSDIQLVSGGVNRGTYEVTLSSTGKTAIQDAITAASGSNYTVSFDSATAPFIIVSAKASAELSKTNFDYDGTTKASDSTDLYVTIAVNDEAGTTVKVALSKEDVNFTADGMNANTYEFNLNATGLQVANAALSAATNGNYQLAANTATTGSVTINKAKATITIISNDQIMYDGSAHSLQIKVNGAVNGENITYTPVNNSHTKAGQYTVTAIADDNNVNSNYDITVVNGSMTIVKAPITPGEITIGNVNGNELNKTYDGKTFGESPVVQGPEHDVTLTIGDYEYLDTDGNVANDPVNSGGYTIRLTQSGIKAVTDANSDYDLGDLSSLANNATIHKAQAHINITSNDHITYDGAAHSLDTEVIGAVNGETITYTVTNNSHTAVGQYEVTATADSNAVNSNYEITDGSGSMTIVKATTPEGEISIGDVNGNDLDKTYDGKTFDESPVVQGPEKDVTLVSGDYEYLDANGNVVANPTNAGNYTIKLTESGITAVMTANGNYDLGDLAALVNKATIHKAQAQINITSNDHITYDGTAHSLDIEVTGAVNGETITYTVANNSHTTVGQYEVTATADDNTVNRNYEITNGSGSMTIVKATTPEGEISIGDANGYDLNKTYDGKTFTDNSPIVVQGPESDVTLTTGEYAYYDKDGNEVTNPVNAGDYTIKLTEAGINAVTDANSGYELGDLSSLTNNATINKAKASINIVSDDHITYDGAAHSLDVAVTGAVNGETITYTVTNNSHTNVGQYDVTATATDNVVNSNYEITNGTGSMTIVKATTPEGEISIGDANGYDLNKTYDGKTFTDNSPIVVQGPETDVTLTTGEYAYYDKDGNEVMDPVNAGDYTIKLTEAGINAVTDANSGYELGDLSSLTNKATIQKAKAGINVISNDNIAYDGTAHSLTIEVTGAVNGETIAYTVNNNGHTNVGQYEVTATADDNAVNSNYEITPGSGSMTIVKATTSGEIVIGDVNGNDLTKTYDGKSFSVDPVVQGPEADVILATGDYEYLDASGNVVSDPTNAGEYTIKLTDSGIKAVIAANSNYELGDLAAVVNKATIHKADASIHIVSNDNITYDGNAHSLNTEVTGAVNGETITYAVTNNSHTTVGQYNVTATADDSAVNDNYNITITNGSMTIVKAPTTSGEITIGDVNGNDLNKTYNGKTFDENPVVQGPETDVILATGDYKYLDANGKVVESPINAGNYTIKLTDSGIKAITAANSNYDLGDLSSLTNAATIHKADANINIVSNDKITYDGAAHSLDIEVTGAVNGETITYTVANNSHTDVGQYEVTATVDKNTVNSNYEITSGSGSMTIVKAPITSGEITIGDVNGNDLNKTYDGQTFTDNPVVQGPEADVTLATGDYEYLDTTGNVVTDPTNAGNYTIKLTESGIAAVTAANSNYELGDLTAVTNEATINKAQASINVASNDDIMYDGDAHSLKIEVIGAVNGETITYTTENNSQTTVGQYKVTATADNNAVNSNYEITNGTGSMTIVKVPTTPGEIIIGDANGAELSKTYDGKIFSGDPVLVVQGPENKVPLKTGEYIYYDKDGNEVADPVNAGNYTIKLTESGIQAVKEANSNYDLGDLTTLESTATINKAPAKINIVSDENITYDGAAHSLAIEVTGAVNGETITYTVTNNGHTAVGQYEVTATADSNAVNSNYEITPGSGSMTIVKAPTTPGEIVIGDVNGNDLNKTYDGKSFSTDPVVQGPEADVTLKAGDYAYYDQDDKEVTNPTNAGNYTIKLTESGITAVTNANSGYELGDLSSLTNNATIHKAQAQINITSNDHITYDGAAHSLAIEVTGAVNGETITYTVTNNKNTAVGQYDVTATATDNVVNSNYEITNGTGSMTIVKAPTTPGEIVIGDVNGNDLNKTYDGKSFSTDPVVQGPEADVTLEAGDYAYYDQDDKEVANPVNAGEYTIKLTSSGVDKVTAANSNYDLGNLAAVVNKATIQKAKASINVTSNDQITYDGVAHSLAIEVTGVANGETITYTVTNNSHTAVGQYEVTATADSNVVNSNYEITNGTGSMTIVKAPTTPGEIVIGDVNGNDLNKTYDGKTFGGNPVVQGPEKDVTLASGDYEYLDANGNVVANPTNAGNYTVKLTESGITAVTNANSGYELGDLSSLTNNATIHKAQAQINITSNDHITYDGAAHSLDTEVIGAVNGETITYTVTNNKNTAVGQYEVTAIATDNDVNNNYEITNGTGSMTIVKATTPEGEIHIGDVNGYDLNKTYDGKTFTDNSPIVVQGPETDVTLTTGEYAYYDKDGNKVTNPVNAGDYTIKLTDAGIKAVTTVNSNYELGDLTTLVNKAVINKAQASVKVISDENVTYDGDSHSLDIEVTGAVNGETITYTTGNNSHTNVGQYDVTVTVDKNDVNSNYDITVTNGSMTIVKATTPEGEISIGDANGYDLNKTYDGKTFSGNPVVQGPEKDVTLESGDYEYLDTNGNVVESPKNAGDYTIKLTGSGIKAVTDANSNYALGDLTTLVNKATIQKAKASINITSDDTIVYDGDTHSLKTEVTGAVNGETITYTTENNQHANVGQYEVTATADDNAVNRNYEITPGSGSMTIVKAPTTPGEIIIGNVNGNALNKTYDGKTFGESPVVQGPEKDVTLESGDYEYLDAKGNVVKDPINAGDYTIKLTDAGIKAVTTANSSYELGDLSGLMNDVIIRKAPAKINIVSNDKIMYDGNSHSLDIEVTGAVNGETITYTTKNNSHINAGQYDVTATADNNSINSNYEITSGLGSMTITKVPITPGEIIIGNADGEGFSKTYDGQTFSENPVVQGPEKDVTLEAGDYEYVDVEGKVVTNPVNAGEYTIRLTSSGERRVADANSNYDLGDLSQIGNKATISKAKATLTVVSNDNIAYDGKAHSLNVDSKGAVNGETIDYTTENNSQTNVGQYDVTVTAVNNDVNNNYDITLVNGSMTIVKATVPEGEIHIGNAKGENINKTYDGKSFDESPVVQGPEADVTLENGDYEYLDAKGNVVKNPVNAGNYQVKLTASGIDKVKAANNNYDIGDLTTLSNTATINKAKASLTVTSNDKIVYDGKSHSLDVVVDGAVNGETISYITENNSHTNVGQYEVTVTANDNNVNSNYDITVVNGSMTIVKANTGSGEMTTQVKVNDASSNYGEATPTFNITIGSDLKSPDNLTNADFIFVDKSTGKVVEGVLTHVGHYEVSLNTSGKAKVAAANPNYELTDKDFISGTYTINDVITHSKLTVSQTVHYTGAGLRTPADKVQSIIYDVATSKATGKSVYTPESGYAAVDTPEINGFTNSGDVAGYTPETTTVKPIDSTVRVTYTPTNELEYSEITVTRTIHYEGAGDQTPQDVIEKVVYKVVTNKTTGEVSYTPQGIFDAVTTPTLSGYTNSGDVAELIPAATMDKPEDSLVVVQYKKISDGNGNNPEKPTNPGEGGHNPGKPGDNNKPGNGGTTPDNGPDVGTDHSGSPEGVKNSKGSQVKLETLAHLNTKHKKDMTVVKAGILPQTDERHENVISALGMVLLSAFLALFGLKRRKHDDEA